MEHFSNALVNVRGNGRAWLHGELEHHRAERVVLVVNGESDVSFAGERETIGLDLRQDFLIEPDPLLS